MFISALRGGENRASLFRHACPLCRTPVTIKEWRGRPAVEHYSFVRSLRTPGLQAPESNVDKLLRTAIGHRRLIRLVYQNKERIVEPHDYGIHNGSVKLLAYQVGGSSSGKLPNWRWMEADLISDLRLLDRTFPGGRPTPARQHHRWDELFIRVKPADEDCE